MVIWLVIFILSSLVQFLVLPFHLGLLLVAWLTSWNEDQSFCWLVFMAGLINDLFLGINFGSSSLFFLWFVYGLKQIRRRFNPSPLIISVLVFAGELVYSQLFFHFWGWSRALGLGVISWFLFNFWPVKIGSGEVLELGLN